VQPFALNWKLCHCKVPRILTGCAQEACRKFIQDGGSKEDAVKLAVGNSVAVLLATISFRLSFLWHSLFFIIDSLASEHEISEASAEADSLESLIHWLHALIGFISFMFQETMMSAAEAAGREAAQSAALADPEKLPPEANEAPEEEALEEDQVVEEAASEDSKDIS